MCPWWLISTFDNPLRRYFQDPHEILAGYVHPGDRIADIGCGIGYFTIPIARLVGGDGRVFAVDLQPRMLDGLRRRAQWAGMMERIEFVQSTPYCLGITSPLDFVLAFWMVHEVPDGQRLFLEIHNLLRPGGLMLVAEPRLHVPTSQFERTVALAQEVGFSPELAPLVRLSSSVLLRKLPGQ